MKPYLDKIVDPVDEVDYTNISQVVDYLHTGQWPLPSYRDYCEMGKHSEYIAWVMYNKYYLNHFTLATRHLNSFSFNTKIQSLVNKFKSQPNASQLLKKALRETYIEFMTDFNSFLKSKGFVLNSPRNSELQISPDGLLLQSSTKSELVDADFTDGTYQIPGSYVEYAYRGIDEKHLDELLSGRLAIDDIQESYVRDGFEVGNADKIFESTYTKDAKEDESDNENKHFLETKSKLLNFIETYQKSFPSRIIC